jgi:hypothetical protein
MRRSAQVAASEQVEERLTKALADVAELRTLLAARDRQIEHLTKMLFARQSERIADDKAPKAAVGLGRVNAAATAARRRSADEECEEIAYKRKKRGATRVSKDLPRETQMLALPEAERRCSCCNEVMCKIGEEVSERLDFTPAVLKVIETRREKYACLWNGRHTRGSGCPPAPAGRLTIGRRRRSVTKGHPLGRGALKARHDRHPRQRSTRNVSTRMRHREKEISEQRPCAAAGCWMPEKYVRAGRSGS